MGLPDGEAVGLVGETLLCVPPFEGHWLSLAPPARRGSLPSSLEAVPSGSKSHGPAAVQGVFIAGKTQGSTGFWILVAFVLLPSEGLP